MKALICTPAQRNANWLNDNIDKVAKDYKDLNREQLKINPNPFLIEEIESRLKGLTESQKK